MSAPKHDKKQSAMWQHQMMRELQGYSGPKRSELQSKGTPL